MLNIEIVNGNTTTGHLEFKVNGSHGNGNGRAKKNWKVHWRVKPNIKVLAITKIEMKSKDCAPTSINILSSDPPQPENGDHKHWKATVNGGANVGEEYIYSIWWKYEKNNEEHEHQYDPKISVMPSLIPFKKLLIAILPVIAGCLTFKFLQKKINR